MIAIGRRVIRLDEPPGATATIAPWSLADMQAVMGQDLTRWPNLARAVELFESHIESHNLDLEELDILTVARMLRAWGVTLRADPPLQGRRH